MRKRLPPDPRNLLPLADPAALGLGVSTQRELEALFQTHQPAPPILKIGGRNFIVEGDRDAFRERLIESALREAMQDRVASQSKGRAA